MLTLVEQAKLCVDPLQKGVIEEFPEGTVRYFSISRS